MEPNYTSLTLKELKHLCKERKIRGYSTKSKSDLINLLNEWNNSPAVSDATVGEIYCPISDSFVHPINKQANGKNGHGERRLYTGDNHRTNTFLTSKPFKIEYPHDYMSKIKSTLENQSIFSKVEPNRVSIVNAAIDTCSGKMIYTQEQNGQKDVCRFYIGPKKEGENVNVWDTFRKTLLPKDYSLCFKDIGEYFLCTIVNANEINTKKCLKSVSNVQMEFFRYKEKQLGIEIQGGHSTTEFQLRNPENGYYWPVDGVHLCGVHRCKGTENAPCEWNKTAWEFHGDWVHGNPALYGSEDTFFNTTYEEKRKKDQKKREFYESMGYRVCIIWESEWIKEKKDMKARNESWV